MSHGLVSSSHWGPLRATVSGGQLSVAGHELDPEPSAIMANLVAANSHRSRVLSPIIRGWFERGPGPDAFRGYDEFVRVDWPTLHTLLGAELGRVINAHGNSAIFGGSYGWGSAGRFHHPQSQVHRFLNQLGGCARSVDNYSTGASSVILPHVLGGDVDAVHGLTSWDVIDRHTTMIVAFGGLPVKNLQVAPGGITGHRSAGHLRRGDRYEYDGTVARYPDIRLVYWCGGNPFHHHQDLSRLRRAMTRPDTVVVHETHWTATAKHADVVVPAATFLERADIGASRNDSAIVAMRRITSPPGEVRTDYETFAELAGVLGVRSAYTEDRSEAEWLRHLYQTWSATQAVELPDFDEFWTAGRLHLPDADAEQVMLADFAGDPAGAPLSTPSGRIELTSEVVRSFRYDDCPAHPTFFPPEQDSSHPLVLVTSQPAHRLHSQLDMGSHSQNGKVAGREPLTMHPDDAACRGIANGSVVLVTSRQGSCLAGARLSDGIKPGCVQLPTGAWYDPVDPNGLCAHGNPNVLTRDVGTSRLAQACSGQLVRVQVQPWSGPAPRISAYDPPATATTHSQEDRT